MVECDYSVLLDIHSQVKKIMKYIKIEHEEQEVITFKEDEITLVIVNNLYRTLDYLSGRDQLESLNNTDNSGQMYDSIERQLQRQQNLNRMLIKKQLEFKEYQKCLIEELGEQRRKVKDLQNQLHRINDRILTKDLEIMHLHNQKKMVSKDKKAAKEMLMIETLVNDKKLGDPFKNIKQSINAHHRRKSDELTRRPSTANPKKKSSVSKR